MMEPVVEDEPKPHTASRTRLNATSSTPNVISFETSLSVVSEESDQYFATQNEAVGAKPMSDFEAYKVIHSASGVDNYRPQPPTLVPFRCRRQSTIAPEILLRINQFRPRVKKPVIDIWWLYDDGG